MRRAGLKFLRTSLLMQDCSTHDALLRLCASRVVDIALPISLVDSAAFVASLVGVAEVGAVSPYSCLPHGPLQRACFCAHGPHGMQTLGSLHSPHFARLASWDTRSCRR